MLPARKYTRQTWLPDIFQDFFENNALEKVAAPAMNVIETDCCYKLELAAPGMTKDDFKVHINSDGNLVIDMERNKEEKRKTKIEERIILKIEAINESRNLQSIIPQVRIIKNISKQDSF